MKNKKQKINCLECGTDNYFKKGDDVVECRNCGRDICTECGGVIRPIIENNGFQAPDPTHYETVGGECVICGKKV